MTRRAPLLLSVVIALALPGVAIAQESPDDGEERRTRRADRVAEALGLSAEQLEEIKAAQKSLRAELRAEIETLRSEGLDNNEIKRRAKQLREANKKAVDALLTDEQRKKLEELRGKRQRGQRGERQRGERESREGRAAPDAAEKKRQRVERIQDALILSEDEQAVIVPFVEQVLDAQEARKAEMGPAREAFKEALKGGGDAAALLAQFRATREAADARLEATREELRSVLTLEQEATLVSMGVLP